MRLFEIPEVPHFARGGLATAARMVRDAGRGGDEILVHVNKAEFDQMVRKWGEPSINPHTGLPEYGFLSKLWKGVKKTFKKFAPFLGIAASVFMPGLAPAIGSALGASGAAASAVGNAAIGALSGGASGGAKGALSGALMGGLGGSAGKIGGKFGLTGNAAKLAGNSLISGLGSTVRGGDFGQGMMSGAISSVMSPSINKMAGDVGKSIGFDPKGIDAAGNEIVQGDHSLDPTGATSYPADMPMATAASPDAANVDFMNTGDPGMSSVQVDPNLVDMPQANFAKPGVMDRIDQGMKWMGKNPGKVALGVLALNAMGGKGETAKKPGMPDWWDDPLPEYQFNRRQTTAPVNSYYTYGEMPEVKFYGGTGMARGGYAGGGEGPLASTSPMFVSQGTGANGRADNIDAKLSEGEYVMDAETVALLGDGSVEDGARKLDEMRERLRKHKGKALAQGKISPHAREAEYYLADGGKVGSLRKAITRLLEVVDKKGERKAGPFKDETAANKAAHTLNKEYGSDVHRVRPVDDAGLNPIMGGAL